MNERLWSTRRTRASRSARPPYGSTSRPKSSAPSDAAIALIVKSRRKRSSRSPARSTVGQRARRVVELRPRRDDVDALAVAVRHDRRPEPLMRRRTTAERSRRARTRTRSRRPRRRCRRRSSPRRGGCRERPADEVDAVGAIAERRDRLERSDAAAALDRSSSAMLSPVSAGCGATPSSARRRSARLTTPTSSSSRSTATRPSSAAVTSARSSASVASSCALTTWLLMIPRTGACARSWPTALSRSSRLTPPTSRPSSTTKTPL